MTRQDLLHELETLLEMEQGSLTGKEKLADIPSWDSMQVLSYILLVQEKLNVVVEGQKVGEAVTVEDLVSLVSDKLAR